MYLMSMFVRVLLGATIDSKTCARFTAQSRRSSDKDVLATPLSYRRNAGKWCIASIRNQCQAATINSHWNS